MRKSNRKSCVACPKNNFWFWWPFVTWLWPWPVLCRTFLAYRMSSISLRGHFGRVSSKSYRYHRPYASSYRNIEIWHLTWPSPESWPQSHNFNCSSETNRRVLSNATSPDSLRPLVCEIAMVVRFNPLPPRQRAAWTLLKHPLLVSRQFVPQWPVSSSRYSLSQNPPLAESTQTVPFGAWRRLSVSRCALLRTRMRTEVIVTWQRHWTWLVTQAEHIIFTNCRGLLIIWHQAPHCPSVIGDTAAGRGGCPPATAESAGRRVYDDFALEYLKE